MAGRLKASIGSSALRGLGRAAVCLLFIMTSMLAAPLQALTKPTTTPSSSKSRIVLEKVDAIPGTGVNYEVSVATCAKRRCPVQVRLVNNTQVYGTLDLDWSVVPGTPTQGTIDESLGVGDPLQKEYEGTTWEFGEENSNVSIAVRTLPLTPQLRGLLVHQRAGFEHVKRRHYLFVVDGKRLVRAWTGKEGAGPTWSSVVIHQAAQDGSHHQNLVYFSGFLYPSHDRPDRLEVTFYSWDTKRKRLEPVDLSNTSIKLYGVIAGTYQAVSKARQFQMSNDCLSSFEVLKSDLFSELKPGQFVVARIGSSRPLAMEVSEGVRSCDPALGAFVTETRIFKTSQ